MVDFPWPAATAVLGVAVAVSVPTTTWIVRGIVAHIAQFKQDVNEVRFRTIESDLLEMRTEHAKLRDELRGEFRRVFEKLDQIARRSGCENG